jgi:hypothetical protein
MSCKKKYYGDLGHKNCPTQAKKRVISSNRKGFKREALKAEKQ